MFIKRSPNCTGKTHETHVWDESSFIRWQGKWINGQWPIWSSLFENSLARYGKNSCWRPWKVKLITCFREFSEYESTNFFYEILFTVWVTDIEPTSQPNISPLKAIFLSPDSNHMTHGTWQIDQQYFCRWILKNLYFF